LLQFLIEPTFHPQTLSLPANHAGMLLRLSFCLFLFSQVVYGQEPFSDGKKIHTRTIFDGKATLELPDDLSYSQPVVLGNEITYSHTAGYIGKRSDISMYCFMFQNNITADQLKNYYNELTSYYDYKYMLVLRDEYVEDGNNSYYWYECRLKDEYYIRGDKNRTALFEVGDGSLLPNYFTFYYMLKDGVASKILLDYHRDINGLEDFRALAYRIIKSYKLL